MTIRFKFIRLSFVLAAGFMLAIAVYAAYFVLSLYINNYSKQTIMFYSSIQNLSMNNEKIFLSRYNDFNQLFNEANIKVNAFDNAYVKYKNLWQKRLLNKDLKNSNVDIEKSCNSLLFEYKKMMTVIEPFTQYKPDFEQNIFNYLNNRIKYSSDDPEPAKELTALNKMINDNKQNIINILNIYNTYQTSVLDYDLALRKKLFNYTMYLITFIIIATLLFSAYLLRFILLNIRNLTFNLVKVSKDEFNEQLSVGSNDELDDIAANIKKVLFQNNLLYKLKNSISSLDSKFNNIRTMQNTIKEEMNTQKTQIQNTATFFNQLNDTIALISDNSLKTNLISMDTKNKTHASSNIIRETIESTKILKETASKIFGILKIINSITEQTELLSLSASIEAARAGEIGKGFNVVANEIRKLSESTIISTKEISSFARQIIKIIKSTAVKTEVSKESLFTIENSVDEITSNINNIAEIAEQESAKCKTILGEVNSVSDLIKSNFVNIDKFQSSNVIFKNKIDQLSRLSGKFKLTKQYETTRKVKLKEVQ